MYFLSSEDLDLNHLSLKWKAAVKNNINIHSPNHCFQRCQQKKTALNIIESSGIRFTDRIKFKQFLNRFLK